MVKGGVKSTMKDTVCSGCSLFCDDVSVKVQKKTLTSLGLCRLGQGYCEAILNPDRLINPLLRGNNGNQTETTIDEALEKAANLLRKSKKPLLFGWSTSPNEVIELGIKLARLVGGTFCSTASFEYGPLLEFGLVGGEANQVSLDEVRNLGEHVIFWGANPAESHHRLASRFTVFPKGDKIPEGRESRTITVVDIRETESIRLANHQLVLKGEKADVEFLSALLKELEGTDTAPPDYIAGVPAIEFLSLVKQLKLADYVAVFYGNGILHAPHADVTLPLLAQLVSTLNTEKRRCTSLPLISYSNTIGSVKACQAEANLPFATDFGSSPPVACSPMKGYLKDNFDAVLVVGMDALAYLPRPAAQMIETLPLIALSSLPSLTTHHAAVVLPTAITGVEAGGMVHRVDGEPLTLKPFHTPPNGLLTEEQILTQLIQRITDSS
jgi:formylmethanofuran dehydrogenase subunit B